MGLERHLSEDKLIEDSGQLQVSESLPAIARRLGQNSSTAICELRRNAQVGCDAHRLPRAH